MPTSLYRQFSESFQQYSDWARVDEVLDYTAWQVQHLIRQRRDPNRETACFTFLLSLTPRRIVRLWALNNHYIRPYTPDHLQTPCHGMLKQFLSCCSGTADGQLCFDTALLIQFHRRYFPIDAQVFALTVLLADDYYRMERITLRMPELRIVYYPGWWLDSLIESARLTIRMRNSKEQACRFFRIAAALPLELQMILCLRTAGHTRNIVRVQDLEIALQQIIR